MNGAVGLGWVLLGNGGCRNVARLACSSSKGPQVVECKHSPTGLGQRSGARPPPQLDRLGKGPRLSPAPVPKEQVQEEDPGKQGMGRGAMGALLSKETSPNSPAQYRPSYQAPIQTRTKNDFFFFYKKYNSWEE